MFRYFARFTHSSNDKETYVIVCKDSTTASLRESRKTCVAT
ncbi:hypothetical protein [Helicobacter sp. T3_23-1059]